MTDDIDTASLTDRELLDLIWSHLKHIQPPTKTKTRRERRPQRDMPEIHARPTSKQLLDEPGNPKSTDLFVWYLQQPEHRDNAYHLTDIFSAMEPLLGSGEFDLTMQQIRAIPLGLHAYKRRYLLQVIGDANPKLFRAADTLPPDATAETMPAIDGQSLPDYLDDVAAWLDSLLRANRWYQVLLAKIEFLFDDTIEAMDKNHPWITEYTSDDFNDLMTQAMLPYGWTAAAGTHRPQRYSTILVRAD